MTNHPTKLNHRHPDGQIEITTYDLAVAHKASQAKSGGAIVDFVFWNGETEEIVEGKVTATLSEDPFRFVVKAENKQAKPQAKVAETARLEREQGGQPQALGSSDPEVNAAGPHDTPELSTDATEGTGMLPKPGEATDDDMAPGG
jgi:hypothetical protein